MESHLVRRDQFNISPQGIIHKPTDTAFIPHPRAWVRSATHSAKDSPMGPTIAPTMFCGSCASFGPSMSPPTLKRSRGNRYPRECSPPGVKGTYRSRWNSLKSRVAESTAGEESHWRL